MGEKAGEKKVDRKMKKFRDRIYGFADIMRTDALFRYNFAKAVLLAALIVFVAFLLGGNTGSSRSAEEIAKSVVPDLMRTETAEKAETAENPEAGQKTETGANVAGGGTVGENGTPSESGDTGSDGENGAPSESDDAGSDGENSRSGENTGVFDGMGQATALDFKRIFGLNAEDYDGVVYFKPISQMDVEELLIVKLASDDQAEALEEAVDDRTDSQKTSFDGYGAAQCALLEKAIVKTRGNFLFYCVSPDAEKYYQAFLDAM